jgi:hypothetical protein
MTGFNSSASWWGRSAEQKKLVAEKEAAKKHGRYGLGAAVVSSVVKPRYSLGQSLRDTIRGMKWTQTGPSSFKGDGPWKWVPKNTPYFAARRQVSRAGFWGGMGYFAYNKYRQLRAQHKLDKK